MKTNFFRQLILYQLLSAFLLSGYVYAQEEPPSPRSAAAENKETETKILEVTPLIPTVVIQDSINFGVQLRIERALLLAKEISAPAVLVELDTPGGYLEVTRKIVQSFLVNDIPIIVYVAPEGARAASAGAMITMAAHFAAMAPSTSIGAATPVQGGGEDIGESMKAKVTNDTVAFVEGIAQKRGRNLQFAKETVTEAKSVTADEALELNAIDGVYASRAEVWQGFVEHQKNKGVEVPSIVRYSVLEMNTKEQAMSFLSNPNIAMGLMALGGLGIYMEMSNPGLVVPGLIGVTALALGAFSTQLIPIQTGAIILLVLGIIFLAIEVLTPLPTFGVAGAASVVFMFLSGLFLMDMEQADISIDPYLWLPILVLFAALVAALSKYAIKALRSKVDSTSGDEGMVGRIAKVTHAAGDHYKVTVFGELWDAFSLSKDMSFAPGEEVIITQQKGLKLQISKKENTNVFE